MAYDSFPNLQPFPKETPNPPSVPESFLFIDLMERVVEKKKKIDNQHSPAKENGNFLYVEAKRLFQLLLGAKLVGVTTFLLTAVGSPGRQTGLSTKRLVGCGGGDKEERRT